MNITKKGLIGTGRGCKMTLIKHAELEFEIAGWKKKDTDSMQKQIMKNLLELLTIFSNQGHSGSSAPYVLNLFNKLARFEIIKPLTGKKSEWLECSPGLWQNKRDSRVFKDRNSAWFIDGKVFSDDEGATFFTSKKSFVPITFPCSAENLKTKYIILKRNKKKELSK
jgi:hypothetical protein